MSSTKTVKKKKKVPKEVVKKEAPPQVVTRALADNSYSGIIREGQLGAQFLESVEAKYTWTSGIKYEGPFVQSRIEGVGKFAWPDGSSYEGELSGGKRHGQGTYIAADGVTKYEGQWHFGKRHGHGKLSYNAEGSSFYDGGWHDGRKHGSGKQVWPSGNEYLGQWESGKMRGEGTMTWKVGTVTESYSGHWEDNQPHGEGSHVWHVPEKQGPGSPGPLGIHAEGSPTKSGQPAANPQQQMQNNKYVGQWNAGKREGSGTFHYANGAHYTGDWKDHKKEGQGRHCNEQGLVYEGSFSEDHMDGRHHVPAHAVNLGSEDNPVCKTTDISDLEIYALPEDAAGLELTIGTGYTEPYKIFREVYNLVLRHLGDLKELYNHYRLLARKAEAESFSLLAYQFWLFARDAGILTPCCSVASLDRAVFSGPRHHRDAAPADAAELAPLTPRPARPSTRQSQQPSRQGSAAIRGGSRASGGSRVPEEGLTGTRPSSRLSAVQERPGSGGSMEEEEEEEEEYESGEEDEEEDEDGSPANAEEGDKPPTRQSTRPSTSHSWGIRRSVLMAGTVIDGSVGRSFQRPAGSLANIHQGSTAMLFRQFVEATIRCAMARFPQEKGLECRVLQMYKLLPLPADGLITASEDVFAFLGQEDFHAVIQRFDPELWLLFGGPGPEAAEQPPSRPVTGASAAATGASPAARTVPPPASRPSSLGLPARQLHVAARLDVTLRVRDLLRLLGKAGFLRAMTAALLPEDLAGAVFAGTPQEDPFYDPDLEEARVEASETTSHHDGASSAASELAIGEAPPTGLMGLMQGGGGTAGLPGSAPDAAATLSFAPPKPPPSASLMQLEEPRKAPRKGSKASKKSDGKEEAEAPAAVPPPPPFDTPAALKTCDFSLTAVQVLRLIVQVLAPTSLGKLRWLIDVMECGQGDERISMQEYLETELIYAEFLRVLVLMAELGTRKHQELREHLTPAGRFEVFLQAVFLPALREPYKFEPPADPAAEAPAEQQPPEEGAEAAAAAAEPEAASVEPEEGAEAAEGEEEPKEEPPIDLWYGFDGEEEFTACGRSWPEGYDEEED